MRHKILIIALLFVCFPLLAQTGGGMYGWNNGNFNPDSLEIATLTGTVIVDSTNIHTMYLIDTNDDDTPDYLLNFGPYWYSPDSSSAQRPTQGETVTIKGIVMPGGMYAAQSVIVLDINGNYWRDPFDSFWDNMGSSSYMGRFGQGRCSGYAFGWMHDSLSTVSISGSVIIDTTFMYYHYYLDVNGDGMPDYFLNFGPPWFAASSGITRPNEGDNVSLTGSEITTGGMPMIIIFSLDGKQWRDSTAFDNGFGGWYSTSSGNPGRFHSPFDSSNWFEMTPGWGGMGMHGGGMFPDSLYCQILEITPFGIPNSSGQNSFAGFEIGMFNSSGSNMMWSGGKGGGNMMFNSSSNFNFHYTDEQLKLVGADKNSISVKYWSDQTSEWITINNAVIDQSSNTVSFSTNDVSNYFILTTDNTTGLSDNSIEPPSSFYLGQNFPNPFNPSTTIRFNLEKSGFVTLNVYDVLGNLVNNLVNGYKSAGSYSIHFQANNLPSGIYFYRIKTGGNEITRKMILMK